MNINKLTEIVQQAIDVPLMDVYNISKIMVDYGRPDCEYGCIDDSTCCCYHIENYEYNIEDNVYGNKFEKCYQLAYDNDRFDYGIIYIGEPLVKLHNFIPKIHNIICDYVYDEKDEKSI